MTIVRVNVSNYFHYYFLAFIALPSNSNMKLKVKPLPSIVEQQEVQTKRGIKYKYKKVSSALHSHSYSQGPSHSSILTPSLHSDICDSPCESSILNNHESEAAIIAPKLTGKVSI